MNNLKQKNTERQKSILIGKNSTDFPKAKMVQISFRKTEAVFSLGLVFMHVYAPKSHFSGSYMEKRSFQATAIIFQTIAMEF